MKAWTREIAATLAAALITITGASVATAAPSRLARGEFAAAVAGLPTIVETFDGFLEGMYAPAIPLANGVYAATGPWVYRVGALNSVLSDGSEVGGPRTFSAFPNGTRYWGADIGMDGRSMLSVTVVGAAETVTFEVRADELEGFLGITDPIGLRAVTIVNVGQFNLAFDNVTTATGAPASRAGAEVMSFAATSSTDAVIVLGASDETDATMLTAAGADGPGSTDADLDGEDTEAARVDSGDVTTQPAGGDDASESRPDARETAPRRGPVSRVSRTAGTTGAPNVAAGPAARPTTTR